MYKSLKIMIKKKKTCFNATQDLSIGPLEIGSNYMPGSPNTKKCFPPSPASAIRLKFGRMFLSGEKPTE